MTGPYTSTPGGSGPPPGTTPEEGTRELWSLFWLAIVNTTIVAVAGVVTWLVVVR